MQKVKLGMLLLVGVMRVNKENYFSFVLRVSGSLLSKFILG